MNSSTGVLMTSRQKFWRGVFRNWQLYVFLAPAVIYFCMFEYAPMYGVQLAFKELSLRAGITASPWADPLFKHFLKFFSGHMFLTVIKNTIVLNLYSLIAGFPLPIILAILLNELKNKRFMKIVQNVTYAPHFISVVILVGMIKLFFMSRGIMNQLLMFFSLPTKDFLNRGELFPHLYVWTGIWQGVGYSSIIYFAALSGVPPELHEAAIIDGASRLKRIWHINLPHILPTVVILLILNTAYIMSIGFEKIFLMQNGLNLGYSEVISTYIYKLGIQQRSYSLGSAVGLFNNVINLTFMMLINQIAKKVAGISLF